MSVRSLGSLTLDMVLKTGNFLGPMDQAQRRTRRTTNSMVNDFKKIAVGVAAAGAAAAAAAAGGIAAMTREGMTAIDAQAKLARSLDGTIDGLRTLNIAASDSGIDGLEGSLNRMNRRLGAVEMNGGPALRTVERLKLNLQEMRDMDVDERLAYVADRIRDSGVSSQEAARHLQQLGFEQRGAAEMFMRGGDAIRAARQEVDDFGLSVSMVDAAAIEAANDALSRSGRLVESARNAMAVELAPIVLAVANRFNDAAREVGGMQSAVQQGVDTSIIYLGTFLDAVWDIDRRIQMAGVSTRAFSLAVVREMANGTRAIIEGPVNALNLLIEQMNRVPGIDMGFVDQFGITYRIADQVQALEGAIARANEELELLSSAGPPSERLNAFIAQAREAAAALAVATGSSDDDTQDPEDPDSPSSNSARSAVDAIANQVAALERQAATLGMTQEAVRLFELAQDGATDSQLAAARAALEAISAYESQEEAAQAYQNLLLDLRTNEERLTDQMRERLAVLDAVNVSSEEYADVAARIAAVSFDNAPSFGGLSPVVGGPFSELARIGEAEEQLQEWYDTQLDMLAQYRQERADLNEQWDAQERELQERHQAELARIEHARQIAQLAAAESVFADLAGITRTFAGEQSGIYRAMFAVQKAAGIAQSIVAINTGMAMAAANPWPANLAAIASVASATAGLVSNIAGTQLVGQAHDGIMSVPESGSWNLRKGERVTTPETSARMDAALDNTDALLSRVEQQLNRPGESSGGVSVNLYESPQRAGQVAERNGPDGERIIDVFVASIMGDGKAHKALASKYGLNTRAT